MKCDTLSECDVIMTFSTNVVTFKLTPFYSLNSYQYLKHKGNRA